MPYIDSEFSRKLKIASGMDLLTYFQTFEPDELICVNENRYTTKTHDSLILSNGKWAWNSRGIGGYNALQFLTAAKDMPLEKAVELLAEAVDSGKIKPSTLNVKSNIRKKKALKLPPKAYDAEHVIQYLCSRGIDREIIKNCIENGLIYQSKPYGNAVFVGHDEYGKPRYAGYRAANETRYMGDTAGSDKRFSFRLTGYNGTQLHVFESAIDALSFATLIKSEGLDWKEFTLLSLGGIGAAKCAKQNMKLPKALEQYLETHPDTRRIYLHLDNDPPGRNAASVLCKALYGKYEIVDCPPPLGKDVNDFLCMKLGATKNKSKEIERNYR